MLTELAPHSAHAVRSEGRHLLLTVACLSKELKSSAPLWEGRQRGNESPGSRSGPPPLLSLMMLNTFFGQFRASMGLIPCAFAAVKSKNMRERSSNEQEG